MRETCVLGTEPIAVQPGRGDCGLEPCGDRGGHHVEGGPKRLDDAFASVPGTHRCPHVRRIRTGPSAGLYQVLRSEGHQQRLPQASLRPVRQEPCATCAQDRRVEARVVQVQTPHVLPIEAPADGIRGGTVGQACDTWSDRHQGQSQGCRRRLATWRKAFRTILIGDDRPQMIVNLETERPLGKSRLGNACGLLRDNRGRGGLQRHGGMP